MEVYPFWGILEVSQQAHDVEMTLYWRRCDVKTSHRRQYDVISTPCACWDTTSKISNSANTACSADVECNHRQLNCCYVRRKWKICQEITTTKPGTCGLGKSVVPLFLKSLFFFQSTAMTSKEELYHLEIYITMVTSAERAKYRIRR